MRKEETLTGNRVKDETKDPLLGHIGSWDYKALERKGMEFYVCCNDMQKESEISPVAGMRVVCVESSKMKKQE